MLVDRRLITAVRVFLVALFVILVVFQFLSMPGQFRHMAEESPDLAHLRWPLTALAGFWILCAQVVIVCTWKLLDRVRDGAIFRRDALPWVDGIVVAVGAVWLSLGAVAAVVVVDADDPGLPFVLLLFLTGVTVVGLLMVVMRGLLRQATELRLDLEAVI